jgi:hypothetical protein
LQSGSTGRFADAKAARLKGGASSAVVVDSG